PRAPAPARAPLRTLPAPSGARAHPAAARPERLPPRSEGRGRPHALRPHARRPGGARQPWRRLDRAQAQRLPGPRALRPRAEPPVRAPRHRLLRLPASDRRPGRGVDPRSRPARRRARRSRSVVALSAEEDVERAVPAVALVCRLDREHPVAMAALGEPVRDQRPEDAAALAGGALAGDHQHAALTGLPRLPQEPVERLQRFLLREAVQVELALDRDLPALQALRRAAIERERRSFAGRGRLLAAHLEAIGETDLRNVADAHRGRVVAVGERADVARRGLPLVLFVAAERVLALQEILVLQEVLLQKIVALFLFAGAVRIHRAEAPRADEATSRRRR